MEFERPGIRIEASAYCSTIDRITVRTGVPVTAEISFDNVLVALRATSAAQCEISKLGMLLENG
jgi:hypothetical protein